jgi:hypothetical protein
MKRRKRRQTPIWNRFDICSAWYVYAVNYHNGQTSREYKIFGRLVNMLYSPGQLLQARLANGLSDNAKLIYRNLVDGAYIRP